MPTIALMSRDQNVIYLDEFHDFDAAIAAISDSAIALIDHANEKYWTISGTPLQAFSDIIGKDYVFAGKITQGFSDGITF